MKLETMARTVLALAMLLLLGLPSRTLAIPAFARKYHTTCARCHTVVPRLNNYGWNFKLRGFHVPGDEEAGKIVMKDDPFLSLIKEIPLGVRAMGSISNSNTSGMNPDVALNSKMELLFGDTLAPSVGTFLELEAEKHAEDNNFDVGIGNIRLMFTDLVKSQPTAVNLEVGRFNLDEFSISEGRRLTQNDYAIYTVVPGVNHFPFGDEVMGVNLNGAFGTGIGVEAPTAAAAAVPAAAAAPVSSAELNELQHELATQPTAPAQERPEVTATRATLDVLVKKGMLTQDEEDAAIASLSAKLGPAPPPPPTEPATTPDATATPAEMPISKTDYDVRKGLFYQAGVVTPGIESRNRYQFFGRLALASPANWWISPYVYTGSQGLSTPDASMTPFNDAFQRLGVDAHWSTGPHRDVAGVTRHALDIEASFAHGRDDNADGLGTRVLYNGGFVEGAYIISDKNLGVLRWDRLKSDEMPGLGVSSLTANFTRYLRRNVKVGVEYVFDALETTPNHQNSNQWSVFYDFAF